LEQRSAFSRAQGSSISCLRGCKSRYQHKDDASQSYWVPAAAEDAAAAGVSQANASAGAASDSAAAAAAAAAEIQGSQQPEYSSALCDYSSGHLPKHLNAMQLRMHLACSAKRLRRAGKQLCMVWQNHTGEGEGDYVFNARPLMGKYPGLQLSIPLQLKWMTKNPGQQGKLTGSFRPLDGENWTTQAYAEVQNE
jgi:hypothetical protein